MGCYSNNFEMYGVATVPGTRGYTVLWLLGCSYDTLWISGLYRIEPPVKVSWQSVHGVQLPIMTFYCMILSNMLWACEMQLSVLISNRAPDSAKARLRV